MFCLLLFLLLINWYKDRYFLDELKPQIHGLLSGILACAAGPQEDGADTSNPASAQMNLYLSEPVIPQNKNPLTFWQDNKTYFPSFAQAVRAYLCVLCTSVDSERLFSAAGNIVDDERNKLTAKNAEMLIFLKVNLPVMLLEKGRKDENWSLNTMPPPHHHLACALHVFL